MVQARLGTAFPWGTFAVNVTGSLILGLLTGAALSGAIGPALHTLAAGGFCGALTTYSTFSYETMRLAQTGALLYAAANVAGSVAAGLGAVFPGPAVTQALLEGGGAAVGPRLWGTSSQTTSTTPSTARAASVSATASDSRRTVPPRVTTP